MKKQPLTERFQQLAGIKPLYESENEKNEYSWVDSNKSSIPRFNQYQAISNLSSNLNNVIKDYGNWVHDSGEVDRRDYGKYVGDNVVGFLKDLHQTKINNMGGASAREKFQNPEDPDAAKAVEFTNSLPNIGEYNHLVNGLEFQAITNEYHNIVDKLLNTPNNTLIPFLIPYILSSFKESVWSKNYDGSNL